MPKYFDIHSHLNASQYDTDREEVIKRMQKTETHTIVIGTDFESSKRAVELAEKYENIYACIGVHPVDNPSETFQLTNFQTLITNPKVVAIGECGFDFYHAKKEEDYERQKKLFLAQLDFALEHNKPLMIHARNAYAEILEVLEPLGNSVSKLSKLRGNVHFFTGSPEIAKRFFAIDFTISFTGVITFPPKVDQPMADTYEVIKSAPLNMILTETDAPYATPIPYRGKRNEPVYVSEVVKRISEIRGEDLESTRAALAENALRMLG